MFSRELLKNIARFASGEALARLCSIAVMIFLGHKYGVVIVGIYALAVSISWYTVPLIDFGLRHIGARLIAQHPAYEPEIVRRIQRRRSLMAGTIIPLLATYSICARLPLRLKIFVLVFSVSSTLYATSLDWVAWGKEHLQLVGGVRALIPFSILVAVCTAQAKGETVLWWAAAGNLAGYILQAVVFRLWWRRQHLHSTTGESPVPAMIADSLAWRTTIVMGIAWFAQIAFNSIDTLMLGVVSGPEQVGLYSSAYRILMQVLVTYYLIILALYPSLSRLSPERRLALLRPRVLIALFAIGTTIAMAVSLLRRELLVIVFGRSFLPAAILILVLAWAIPLDFVTSYLNNAYIAWGMERKLLRCIVVAAGTNIILNIIFLPKYGAMAAAVNTIIAYFVYLAGLNLVRRAMQLEMRGRTTLLQESK